MMFCFPGSPKQNNSLPADYSHPFDLSWKLEAENNTLTGKGLVAKFPKDSSLKSYNDYILYRYIGIKIYIYYYYYNIDLSISL